MEGYGEAVPYFSAVEVTLQLYRVKYVISHNEHLCQADVSWVVAIYNRMAKLSAANVSG